MGHPWEITFGQFVSRVQSEFGATLETYEVVGPRGPEVLPALVIKETGAFAALWGVEDHDLLTESGLRSLCDQLGIPADLFGLEPDDDPVH
ncbi:MAG: hypothetical protein SX243_00790 [Acidobacteriota bacterium]|nr:hypothetical protein [Acidobacteriota bacterium]